MDQLEQSPNFINPAYITPAQEKQLREYSKQLQEGSLAPTAKHWTGAIANALMGLRGQQTMDTANQQQRQMLQQGQQGLQQAGQTNPYAAMLMGLPQPQPQMQPQMAPQSQAAPPSSPVQAAQSMQPADVPAGEPARPGQTNLTGANTTITGIDYGPDTDGDGAALPKGAKPIQYQGQQGQGDLSAFYMNPSIPPEMKAKVMNGLAPQGVADAYGNPGFGTALGGVQRTPVKGGFQTGVKVPVSTPQGATETIMSAPGPGGNSPNYGGSEGVGAALGGIAKVGRDLENQSTFNKAATVPQAEAITQDQKDAAQAPQVFRVVNTIIDDLGTHGNAMSMGPTANWSTEAKKVIANFAPGAMTEKQLAGMAANEAMDKASSTLGTLLGKQIGGLTGGHTDASMFEGLKQVPGAHNSLLGAKALADMIKQGTILQQRWGEEYRKLPNGIKTAPDFDYIGERNRFYRSNPIINPLTHNDIMLDMKSQTKAKPEAQGGGWGIK